MDSESLIRARWLSISHPTSHCHRSTRPKVPYGVQNLSGKLSLLSACAASDWQTMASKTPTLIWAQRVEKVFVTWECLATKEVNTGRT